MTLSLQDRKQMRIETCRLGTHSWVLLQYHTERFLEPQ
jgi:hypothetical protein